MLDDAAWLLPHQALLPGGSATSITARVELAVLLTTDLPAVSVVCSLRSQP
jgi:hypothetical protein